MQKLVFEHSWERAIAHQDKLQIVTLFNETKASSTNEIRFIPIRNAQNYKKEFLITVLIHNFSDQPLLFQNTPMKLYANKHYLSTEYFTMPHINLLPQQSMPWTFIFKSIDQNKITFQQDASYTVQL